MPLGGATADDSLLIHHLASLFAESAPKVIGVAVSGGGDSMALLDLMHRASATADWRIEAVTVDHALRPEAAAEARMVAAFCAGIGAPHTTLAWQHDTITGNLMDQARRARRNLIAGWARERGISTVVLGHTADDQAETLLMEMGRAAGLDGMSGMRAAWQDQGVRWRRPLLHQSRASLRAYLTAQGIAWVDDPTNDDGGFTRVKARRALQALTPLGITAERMAAVADHLAASRNALIWAVEQAAAQLVREAAGALTFDRMGFMLLPSDLQRRLLIAALRWLSGKHQAPRGPKVDQMLLALTLGKDATLAGCRLRHLAGTVLLVREPQAVADVVAQVGGLWDGRWLFEGPEVEGQHVAALGSAGLRHCPDWRATGLRREVLLVTPALWRREALVAAPLAGQNDGWKARIAQGFQSFLVSH